MRQITEAEKSAAKKECFAICSVGGFLDPENGCLNICKSPNECTGFMPYFKQGTK